MTRTIEHFINKNWLPRDLVERKMLLDLNTIFQPDGAFTRILVRQPQNGFWEVYLEESGKGLIPVSQSGSGVKTVLLVLVFVHLVPHVEKRKLEQYLFGFEELENNLHPALQRRLLLYLNNVAAEHKCKFFLTTHSNVAIDLFANSDNAQVIHVTHNGEKARVRRVSSYGDSRGVLDDLDIRASDLLQANGIVWVEGPSDRLYFNRWIELWSNGELRENAHYQCVYYGGSLLAHLSVEDPEIDVDDLVKVLRVNRNAILILDSDRKRETDQLNPTKKPHH
jgi:putative ATP-dependent endonuclease of OLD family